METDLGYYFNNYDDNEIFKQLIQSITDIWDIHTSGNEFLKKRVQGQESHAKLINENVTFIGNYYIGEGTVIYPGVTIEGPVYIGSDVKIMPGAYVRPGSIIGDKCVVGFNSEVKNSILQNGAKVASLVFVGDSILGKSVRLGSGVITANRRFDQKNIELKQKDGTKKDTKTDFFGAILGDYTRIGANSVLSPGTVIGPYTWVYPLTSIHGFIPKEKRVFNKSNWEIEDNSKVDLK